MHPRSIEVRRPEHPEDGVGSGTRPSSIIARSCSIRQVSRDQHYCNESLLCPGHSSPVICAGVRLAPLATIVDMKALPNVVAAMANQDNHLRINELHMLQVISGRVCGRAPSNQIGRLH